jgi:hypothetical protein
MSYPDCYRESFRRVSLFYAASSLLQAGLRPPVLCNEILNLASGN